MQLWLPKDFPSNISCILSCSSSSQTDSFIPESESPIIRFDETIFKLYQDKTQFLELIHNSEVFHNKQANKEWMLKPVKMLSIEKIKSEDESDINPTQSLSDFTCQFQKLVNIFGFLDYHELNKTNKMVIHQDNLKNMIFFGKFIFPKLLKRPGKMLEWDESKSKSEWLFTQFQILCPEEISFNRLKEILYFLKLTNFGLTITDLANLTFICSSKLEIVIKFLKPLLIQGIEGYRLSSPFLLKAELEVTCKSILNDGFVKLMNLQKNKSTKIFELANFYINESQYFSLKQTLSKIDNFLLLFNYSTKYSLFK